MPRPPGTSIGVTETHEMVLVKAGQNYYEVTTTITIPRTVSRGERQDIIVEAKNRLKEQALQKKFDKIIERSARKAQHVNNVKKIHLLFEQRSTTAKKASPNAMKKFVTGFLPCDPAHLHVAPRDDDVPDIWIPNNVATNNDYLAVADESNEKFFDLLVRNLREICALTFEAAATRRRLYFDDNNKKVSDEWVQFYERVRSVCPLMLFECCGVEFQTMTLEHFAVFVMEFFGALHGTGIDFTTVFEMIDIIAPTNPVVLPPSDAIVPYVSPNAIVPYSPPVAAAPFDTYVTTYPIPAPEEIERD